jgi:hypothetical protein
MSIIEQVSKGKAYRKVVERMPDEVTEDKAGTFHLIGDNLSDEILYEEIATITKGYILTEFVVHQSLYRDNTFKVLCRMYRSLDLNKED